MIRSLLVLLGTFLIFSQAAAGTWTANEFSYKPALGARGETEKNAYDSGQDRVDARLGKERWVGDPSLGDTAQAAVTALGSTTATLRVPRGTHTISADFTVPANITLMVERGAVFAIATGKTLTINGGFHARLYQAFSCAGTGKVVFGAGSVQEVYPEWFYDAGGYWATAFQKAADAAATTGKAMYGGTQYDSGAKIKLAPQSYNLGDTTVTFYLGQILEGAGREVTSILSSAPIAFQYLPAFGTYDVEGPKFKGFTLTCAYNGIKLGEPQNSFKNTMPIMVNPHLEDVLIVGSAGADSQWGVQGTGCFDSRIRNSEIVNFERLVDWHSCDIGSIVDNRFIGGKIQIALNAGLDIQGLSRASSCVVTWANHGMQTGDKVRFNAILQSGWDALNYGPFTITRINDNSFSIPVDSSGYSAAYNPNTDPGLYYWDYFTGSQTLILHNDMLSPYVGATAFIVTSDNVPRIWDNYMEAYTGTASLESAIKMLHANIISIKNNRLDVKAGVTSVGIIDFRWHHVDGGPPHYVELVGNTDGGLTYYTHQAPAFGWHNYPYNSYYNYFGVRRKITHHHNSGPIDAAMPFNSVDVAPTWEGNTAFVGSPNLPGLASMGGSTRIYPQGCFEIEPHATKNNSLLSWPHTGVNGTVTIAIEAKAGIASQEVKVERLDGDSSIATATQALTTSWAWYKVFTGVAVSDLGINIWNEDVGHGQAVTLRRVVVTYD